MARPKNRSDPVTLTVSLPKETHAYFVLLASLGKLAWTENDVGAQILIAEHQRMDREEFHNKPPPPVPPEKKKR